MALRASIDVFNVRAEHRRASVAWEPRERVAGGVPSSLAEGKTMAKSRTTSATADATAEDVTAAEMPQRTTSEIANELLTLEQDARNTSTPIPRDRRASINLEFMLATAAELEALRG